MGNFALVRDGVIENIIIVKEGDWLDQHVADEGYDKALDTSTLDSPVGPGYVLKGSQYVPPVVLAASKTSIASTGNDAATITYTDNRANPPATVDGTVNGQTVTVALTAGSGSFDVTSTNSGDTILVAFPEISISIGVS